MGVFSFILLYCFDDTIPLYLWVDLHWINFEFAQWTKKIMLAVIILVSQKSTWDTIEKGKNPFHLKSFAYVVKIDRSIFLYSLDGLEFDCWETSVFQNLSSTPKGRWRNDPGSYQFLGICIWLKITKESNISYAEQALRKTCSEELYKLFNWTSTLEGILILYLSYSFMSPTMIVPIVFSLISLVYFLLWVF